MDELSGFLGAPPGLIDAERALMRDADLVLTGGHSLYEAKRHLHPNIHPIPSSVDVAHFARARQPRVDPAGSGGTSPHPRIGFFGVLDERFDAALLGGVAAERPDWQFVLIGPVAKIDPASLPQRANIHYLGAKPYSALPDYLAGWSVALLPFARNASTRFISPTKTPEYLAAGKPVVSTSIRDVVRPYGEAGWRASPTRRTRSSRPSPRRSSESPERLAARADAFLSRTSWDATWDQVSRLMAEALIRRAAPAAVRTPATLPGAAIRDRVAGECGVKAFDYLIVGAGFAGAVLAERLAEGSGKRVLVVDKRLHIGGNAYDHYDEAGVLVHKYGPHIFHTNSRDVFEYLSRFTAWRPYQHRVRAWVDGQLVPMPINLDTVNTLYGLNLTSFQVEEFFASMAEPCAEVRTSEDVIVSKVGRVLYEKFFRNYTRKQWGLDPSELDATSRPGSRFAPIATTATSPIPIRPCHCTATPGCSSGCCVTRTSR